MYKGKLVLIVALFGITLLIVSCGGGGGGGGGSAAPANPVIGTWAASGGAFTGMTVTFDSSNNYSLNNGSTVIDSGTYTADSSTISFTTASDGSSTSITYTLSGNTATVTGGTLYRQDATGLTLTKQ